MNHKGNIRGRSAVLVSTAALGMGLGALGACAAEFELACPEGTVQTAGGGDVGDACQPIAGAGGSAGAAGNGAVGAGAAGGNPGPGQGGSPGGAGNGAGESCVPDDARCVAGARQVCGGDGTWGASVACDVDCHPDGKACLLPVQLAVGAKHACARMSDGTVRCWGSGEGGLLGNGTLDEQLVPQQVQDLTGVEDLVAGRTGTCARRGDGAVYCWGSNASRMLQDTAAKVLRPALLEVQNLKAVTLGDESSCVLTSEGVFLCKGGNAYGKLGNDSLAGSAAFVAPTPAPEFSNLVQVASAPEANLVVTGGGRLFCWGKNTTFGVEQRLCAQAGTPTPNSDIFPEQMITKPTLVSQLSSVRSVAASEFSACALQTDGTVMCWGLNDFAQLGRDTTDAAAVDPAAVSALAASKQIAVGKKHACAVTNDSDAFCWGANTLGQAGIECSVEGACSGASVPRPKRVEIGKVAEVRSREDFTCALTAESKVLCWGANEFGQLGRGSKSNVGQPTPAAVVWR